MLMVFQRGMRTVQVTSMSRTMRSDGRTPQIHSFWAMNSLSMSFCSVPPSASGAIPRRSAATT